MIVDLPDLEKQELPLTAETSVSKGGFIPRVRTAAYVLFQKFAGSAAGL